MPTLTSVNAQWTNAISVPDADSRRINAGSLVGDGTALGARGGIVYHGPSSLAVTVNGSDQIIVQPGVVAIPSSVALAGVYMAAFGTTTGPSAGTAVATRNSTNPRIDLVIADIASGVARIRTVEGTPSSSPAPPALPAGAVEISRLNVPQVGGGAIVVDSTWRTFTTSLGGRLLVPTAARLPTSGVITGQTALALDTGVEHRWDATTWRPTLGAWTTYAPTWTASTTNPSLGNGTLTGSYTMTRGLVVGRFKLSVGTTTTLGSGAWAIGVPLPPASGYDEVAIGSAKALDLGLQHYGRTLFLQGSGMFGVGATGDFITGSAPFAWNNGDIYAGTFTYEPA